MLNTNRLISILTYLIKPIFNTLTLISILSFLLISQEAHAKIRAGVAKIDITDRTAGLVNDPLYVKALVLDNGLTKMVIITLDVVALEEIGPIKEGYLSKVRSQIQKELNIPSSNILINASHCHGIVRADTDSLTVLAVKEALKNLVPVNVGAGTGYENRIMENRRYNMKDGSQTDARRAYSLPPDHELAEIGPTDPEIGIFRLNKLNGETLAVLYNFAVHPIQGVPNGGNTADIIGFASRVIEDNLKGSMALFLQGCGGDINPVNYKGVDNPTDAEPLGNMLGLSILNALQSIKTGSDTEIKVFNEYLELPRADFAARITTLEAEQNRILNSLRGTNINLKSFITLNTKYNNDSEYPSFYRQRYMQEGKQERIDMIRMDSINRRDMENYRSNIYMMERLTRIRENLSLVKMHQQKSAGAKTIKVEILGVKIGNMRLITFPGELTVQLGLNIKKSAPNENTFVAAYTNGYIYYAPTAEQLRNTGEAQEDSDTNLAPEWQMMFENKAAEILRKL
jgi:hypothetical protein